jgi:hypothetical protein
MVNANLLKIDDPNWSFHAQLTYYEVPRYVWYRINAALKDYPVPPSEPWNHHP